MATVIVTVMSLTKYLSFQLKTCKHRTKNDQ